jgi:hypothetical protein
MGLFAEDFGHEKFLTALIKRIAASADIECKLVKISVRGGHGKVLTELNQYLRDKKASFDLHYLTVAVDANKRGRNETIREIDSIAEKHQLKDYIIHAVPEPHIERWMMIDGAAFKQVFGRGCDAPDQEFGKARYKKLLLERIQDAGIDPFLGGMEFADDIATNINLQIRNNNRDLADFLDELESALRNFIRAHDHP